MVRKGWLVSMSLLGLAACTSQVPVTIRAADPSGPGVAQVQASPQAHVGARVRWGGEIIALHNRAEFTDVEIYARALYSDGEPHPDGGDGVRFMARVPGFVDPLALKPERRMTVVGKVLGESRGQVGDFAYRYPLVAVDTYYSWAKYQPPRERDPFLYDPWWPNRPWGPWPYW